TLSSVAEGAAILGNRVPVENFFRVRPIRVRRVLKALPLDSLMAGRAAVGAIDLLHPDLLDTSRNRRRTPLPKALPHQIAKLGLIPFPLGHELVPIKITSEGQHSDAEEVNP